MCDYLANLSISKMEQIWCQLGGKFKYCDCLHIEHSFALWNHSIN